jgi:hypothetical protein
MALARCLPSLRASPPDRPPGHHVHAMCMLLIAALAVPLSVALVELRMRQSWTPSIVPNGADQTVYLVLNDFGRLGRAYCEASEGRSDLESGRRPVRQRCDLSTGDVLSYCLVREPALLIS